ncbi:MAG TPA: ABC transporter permease [Verrucomicrobiota bacterium]|nr:ABC transporter permease [Verrucomicrobiota bacterium]
MTLLIGALTIGLILSLLALGVLVSFRIFSMPDITTDGSITLGASVAAILLVKGVNPVLATAAGALGGAVAGATTGVLHTRFKINSLLAGILVMTALYSINLHVMGRSNVPLMQARTLATHGEQLGERFFQGKTVNVLGWSVASSDASLPVLALIFVSLAGVAMFTFFRTQLGTALRATGDNPQMIRALGSNVERNIILGLALSNGFVALSGSLLAQYQGFADAQMGIGMVVWGLASVIIGEALTGARSLGLTIIGTIMGSVLFRLLVAIALRWGLNPHDLKLITALFVFAALVLPSFIDRLKRRAVLSN